MKTTLNLGRVSVNPCGDYSDIEIYSRLDKVAYNGSSWICLKDNTEGIEPAKGEYWMLEAEKGATGETGATWLPSVDEDGTLTWTKDSESEPASSNIKGPPGDPSTVPGPPGEDGFSPTVAVSKEGKVTTVTITDADGPHPFEIKDGADGTGAGDMTKDVYDTQGRETDIFDYVDEAVAGVQPELEFDDTPKPGSQNPVTSNGIYEALQNVSPGGGGTAGGNIILRDEATETNYTLAVESGRLTLLEVSGTYTPGNAPAIVDTGTGETYTLYVENGKLGLKEE